MDIEYFIQNNEIFVPCAFLFLAVVIKIFAVAGNTTESKNEMMSHLYLSGVELCILSLSIYALGGFVVRDFLGFPIKSNNMGSIVTTAIFNTILQIIILGGAIFFFRSRNHNSFILRRITSDFARRYLRLSFIILSLFMGALSVKLLIHIVSKAIYKS